MMQQSSAKRVSIIAVTAALYTVFFFLSFAIGVPTFTVLFLPIILLGVFPLWFGWSGLVGSMIGAFIGGVYVEGLPLHLAWVEITTAIVIYGLNWLLIPKISIRSKNKKGPHNPLKHLCLNPIRRHMLYPLAIFSCRFVPCGSCLASITWYFCPQLTHCIDCMSSFD